MCIHGILVKIRTRSLPFCLSLAFFLLLLSSLVSQKRLFSSTAIFHLFSLVIFSIANPTTLYSILDIKIIARINPTHRSPLPPNSCCGLLLLLCPRTSPTYRVRFINLLLLLLLFLLLFSSLRLSLSLADISLRLSAISGSPTDR